MFTKPRGHLTPDQAREIQARHADRSETILSMAKRFGISEIYCGEVARMRRRKIPEPWV